MSVISFDSILERKIGFGKYQYIAFCILALVDFTDGVELITMSVVMPILKNEWGISNFVIEITSSIFYLGMFLGAIITGKIADQFGRKYTIIFSCMLQFFVSIFFAMINSVFFLIILRFLYGFCYGFSLPLTISSISEITPKFMRGKLIICVNFCVTLGKLYGLLLAYICLNDFNSGNWRIMMFLSAFTSLIVSVMTYFFLKESPRFLIASGQIDEGVEILNSIGLYNNSEEKFEYITDEEKKGLVLYQQVIFSLEEKANFKNLFNNDNLGITLRLWSIWFALIFIEFGQYTILPFIFSSSNVGFSTYIYTILGETPAIVFSLYLIDKPYFGRKNTLSICLSMLTLINSVIFLGPLSLLTILLSLERFFMKDSFSMLVPLTSEVYPTLYRTIGYGLASASGRAAAFIAPFILFYLYRIQTYLPFFAFAIACAIATFSSLTLPFDTMGKNLDEKDDLKERIIELVETKDSKLRVYNYMLMEKFTTPDSAI